MGTPETVAGRFAAFGSRLALRDLPDAVTEAAKLHALDALGCGLAALGLDAARAPRAAIAESGGAAQATAIGMRDRLPAESAALVNGVLCHSLDYDDTHPASVCHVSAAVVPAALAAAEASDATGEELVTAIVVGNEIVTRLGMAAPSAFHDRGFHPTGVCGVFGAVLAAARLRGLSAEQTTQALGIAGSMASGIFEYLSDGSETKPLHPAWAAHAGILACRLAAHGATGPATVFEGRFGVYGAYLGRHDVDLLSQAEDLGERWETTEIAFKPYPACHFMHSCLDAATEVLRGGIDPDEIDDIEVSIPSEVVPIVLEPLVDKRTPRTPYDAKFSLPFSVAAMAIHGAVGIDTYTPAALADSRVLELSARVHGAGRHFPSYPESFPGAVVIRMRDGRRLAAEVIDQRGGRANPMTDGELREKFRRNARLALPPTAGEELEEAMMALERRDDVSAALRPLATAATAAQAAA